MSTNKNISKTVMESSVHILKADKAVVKGIRSLCDIVARDT